MHKYQKTLKTQLFFAFFKFIPLKMRSFKGYVAKLVLIGKEKIFIDFHLALHVKSRGF